MTGRLMRRSLLAHKTHMHNVNAYAQEHICTRALTLPPPPPSVHSLPPHPECLSSQVEDAAAPLQRASIAFFRNALQPFGSLLKPPLGP